MMALDSGKNHGTNPFDRGYGPWFLAHLTFYLSYQRAEYSYRI